MKTLKEIVTGFITFLLIVSILYGFYWVAKTLSYNILYKDMVKSTITQMVKQEALK